MRSLRRSLPVLAVAGVAVLVTPLLAAGSASADAVDDQRARVEYYADLLEQLEEQSFRLGEEYDVALDELAQLETDVVDAEEAVAEKQAEVAELQAELGDVAVQAYINAGTGGMGIFSRPDEFNAELQRHELTRVALDTGTADSDDLEQALNDLAEEQENLETQRRAAEDQAEAVADAQEATESQTAEYTEARASAEEELGNLIREEEERRARESYERMQAEAAAAAARAQAQAQQQQQQSSGGNSSNGANSSNGGNSSNGANSSNGGNQSPAPAAPAAPPAAPSVPPASSRAGTAVNAAVGQQGTPYKYAAASPGVAFDCSGLTSWAWGQAGVYLPHQSAQQYAGLPHVPTSAVQPGDLIFFYSPISHVGMYIGGGNMVHAPNSGSVVHIRAVNWGNVTGVGRPS